MNASPIVPPTDERGDEPGADREPVVQPGPSTQRQRLLGCMATLLSLRWPRLTWAAVALGLASVVALLALFNSPLLDVNSVKVEGADVVSAAAVRQLVGLKGLHVMRADLEAAERRVASLPMVREVAISRDWPSSVKVVIVERKPWGWWRANNTVWPIDAEGVILEGTAPSYNGPIVTQVSAMPAIKAGAAVDLTAVQMAQELDRRGAPLPLPGILAYEWSLADGLVVVTEHGRVIFGDANGFEYKYAVWDLLEREAQRRGEPLLFADLRFGLRPRVEIGLNVGRDIRIHDRSAASIEN